MSNWCWAACTDMVLKYFGAFSSQSQIVVFTYGEVVNKSANVTQISAALANWNVNSIPTASMLAFSTIISQIENNEPMISGRNGHAQLIRGYYQDTSNNIMDVYYIEPWDGTYRLLSYGTYSSTWNGGSVYYIYV